jgi:hypothetical protein
VVRVTNPHDRNISFLDRTTAAADASTTTTTTTTADPPLVMWNWRIS